MLTIYLYNTLWQSLYRKADTIVEKCISAITKYLTEEYLILIESVIYLIPLTYLVAHKYKRKALEPVITMWGTALALCTTFPLINTLCSIYRDDLKIIDLKRVKNIF